MEYVEKTANKASEVGLITQRSLVQIQPPLVKKALFLKERGLFYTRDSQEKNDSAQILPNENSGDWSPNQKPSSPNDYIEIPLSRGMVAKISPEDEEWVRKYNWFANRSHQDSYYATRNYRDENGKKKKGVLHREIMKPPPGMMVDHISRDTLDNRRCNLRLATPAQNARNIKKPKHGVTSKYKGVSWNRNAGKFECSIRVNGKRKYLGLFESEFLAAKRYDMAAKELHGCFASINFPEAPSTGARA